MLKILTMFIGMVGMLLIFKNFLVLFCIKLGNVIELVCVGGWGGGHNDV